MGSGSYHSGRSAAPGSGAVRRGAARLGAPAGRMLLIALLAAAEPAGAQVLKTIGGGRWSVNGPDAGFADGDTATTALFDTPMGCAVDAAGNLLVADTGNRAVRKLDVSRNLTTTVITNLNSPVALALDRTNNLYVLDQGAGRVLRYDWFDTQYRAPTAAASGLNRPTALALGAQTNLYITEMGGAIKLFRVTGDYVTTLTPGLSEPRGLAVLNNGWLAVSDSGNHVIRFLDPANGAQLLQVGTGAAGFADGGSGDAQFNHPYQLAKGPNGNLAVADRQNHRVRLISTSGNVVTLYGVDPTNWVGPCLSCNPIVLPGWYDGVNGGVSTAEARDPVGVAVGADGLVYTTEIFYHIIRRVTGAGLGGSAGGGGGGGTNQVALAPLVSPLSGYYPMGTEIRVLNPNLDPILSSQVFYTTDGTEPGPDNPSSREVGLTNNAGTILWQETQRDLTSLRVKAFLGGSSSSNVAGVPVTANQVGVATDVRASVGATVMIPIIANLRAGQTLKSLQFLVEVTPRLAVPLRVQSLSPNDFVPVLAATTDTPIARSGTNETASWLEVAFIGTNTSFTVNNFATVAMMAVPIPPTAKLNDRYTVTVKSLSGTADGRQARVDLVALPPATVTVANTAYMVGDTSSGKWYNAGGFGDGRLDNSDVNNAFYASLGVRLPPPFTDAFDAMDAFPEDREGEPGGDGRIRFLDWQVLLDRSLRSPTNNWFRAWATNGSRVAINPALGGSSLQPGTAKVASQSSGVQISRINAPVELQAASLGDARPGQNVSVPVHVNLAANTPLAGVQFRAIVEPAVGAPPLDQPVLFAGAPALPAPLSAAGLPLNQAACAWSPLAHPFPADLTGRVQLGELRFQMPASAVAGQTYTVKFANADGAADLQRPYDVASLPGSVTVLAPPRVMAPIPNFRLTWLGALGRRYVLESTTDLSSGRWMVEAENLVGRGNPLEFVDQNAAGKTKFYRVGFVQ